MTVMVVVALHVVVDDEYYHRGVADDKADNDGDGDGGDGVMMVMMVMRYLSPASGAVANTRKQLAAASMARFQDLGLRQTTPFHG